MKGFLPILTGFLLAGLVVMGLFMGSNQLATNNDDAQSMEDIPELSGISSELESTLESTYGSYNESEDAVSQSPVTQSGDTIFLDAIAGVWATMKNTPTLVYNVLKNLIRSSGISSPAIALFFSVIGGIIIVTVVLYAWKMIRTGEPG